MKFQLPKTMKKLHRKFSKQTWNQSIVQQLINEGNCLNLLRKASPIGLMHNIMCKLSLHRLTKYVNKARGEKSAFLSCACANGLTAYKQENQKIM